MSGGSVQWRRMSRGVLLAGYGVFLLLTTMGVLSWSFWLEAVRLWPVLLVGLGLRLIFERSRAPWAILLSPLVILGTLTWVALAGTPAWGGTWEPVRIERPDAAERWRLEGSLVFASAGITARPLPEALLVAGRCAGMGPDVVQSHGDPRHPVVELDPGLTRWRWPGTGNRGRRCELDVSAQQPVSVDLDTAFARARFDLAAATVPRVGLDGAFNSLTLRLGAPASVSSIDLEGAFNRIVILVPRSTPVSVRTDGPLNIVSGRHRTGRESGPGWVVTVDGAFNRIVVRSDAVIGGI